MPRPRVLIVDDSVVMRRLISEALSADDRVEVAGFAAHGSLCLAKLEQRDVDLVVLDLEMPVMDGLETIAAIRQKDKRLPILVFSAYTRKGGVATLDALSAGASDYLAKPEAKSPDEARQKIREGLVERILALCAPGASPAVPAPRPAPPPRSLLARTRPPLEPRVLVIGSSTGGPPALEAILPKLPREFPIPVLVVQHMPPKFTRLMAERLDQLCPLKVREAGDGEPFHAGGIWLARGDHHLGVTRAGEERRASVHQEAHENSCRPAADILFRTAAECYEGAVLAVVLTGMGSDGCAGCERIQQLGGQVIAQDQATSIVWGMPGAVARAGLADAVLPLPEIAADILRRVGR